MKANNKVDGPKGGADPFAIFGQSNNLQTNQQQTFQSSPFPAFNSNPAVAPSLQFQPQPMNFNMNTNHNNVMNSMSTPFTASNFGMTPAPISNNNNNPPPSQQQRQQSSPFGDFVAFTTPSSTTNQGSAAHINGNPSPNSSIWGDFQ